MQQIMGKTYMVAKEASKRYGFSVEWFLKYRKNKKGPPYIQHMKHCKVLYELEGTDAWFNKYFLQRLE